MGVPVVIQPVWFVVVLFIAVSAKPAVQERMPHLSDGASYGIALAFVLLLYVSVFLHEISHVAVARALGMQVRRLVLHLLGGVTEVVEEMPGQARREYLVAIVGPMTSMLLGLIGLALAPAFSEGSVPRLLVGFLAVSNLILAAFNSLPGLPLDGGRVLRALLWQVTHDKVRGTRAAGWFGRALAVSVLGVAIVKPGGLAQSTAAAIYLAIVAAYIWMGATMSMTQAKVSEIVPGLDLRALTRRALPVTAELPVAEAVRRARDAGARALVVVDGNGKPSGLVSEARVSALPQQRQPWVSVSDLARPVVPDVVLPMSLTGEELMRAVQERPATEYLVVDAAGKVCGVLARIDIVAALQAAGLR